jgi:hypothetical protein
MKIKTTFHVVVYLLIFVSFFSFVAGCSCVGIRWGLPQEIRFFLVILYMKSPRTIFDLRIFVCCVEFVSSLDIEESNRVKL